MGKIEFSLKKTPKIVPLKKIRLLVHLLHDSPGSKAKNRNGFPSRFGQETKIENGPKNGHNE